MIKPLQLATLHYIRVLQGKPIRGWVCQGYLIIWEVIENRGMERKEVESLGPTQLEALGQVPDPRSRHGRRHPLPAILTLATCAMLCGCNSLYAIAQWGREPEGLARTLGFPSGQTPCVATLHLVFKRLDKEAFEEALSGWSQGVLGMERRQ